MSAYNSITSILPADIPNPPSGGFCILVSNGGTAVWVQISGNGLLKIDGTNISIIETEACT